MAYHRRGPSKAKSVSQPITNEESPSQWTHSVHSVMSCCSEAMPKLNWRQAALIVLVLFFALLLIMHKELTSIATRMSPTRRTGDAILDWQAAHNCSLQHKDVQSALRRAKTEQCRLIIAQTACKLETRTLTHTFIERNCPVKDLSSQMDYVGCFADTINRRVLNGTQYEFPDNNSPETCVENCLRVGFQLAGVQYRHECFCGHMDSLERTNELQLARCQMYPCPNRSDTFCGGYKAMAVYNTGFGKRLMQEVSYVPVEGASARSNTVRLVFLLQLNGRDVRQVQRLLKQIYRPEHYYYVHVDTRQHYMYKAMQSLKARLGLPNMHVTEHRFATIWGGNSLLRMMLSAAKEILALTKWTNWELMINLSESDLMLATMDELQALLKRHRGSSFLRSHGSDASKFIKKQGLDFVFVECENRMWRLGQRERMPAGVWFDGGSDWVGLHRDLLQYAVYSTQSTNLQLQSFYTNVLLPVESFFHTLSYNSPLCERVHNTNLKTTNWRRDRGCKCQYKHVVDWCGCSPLAFTTADWQNRLDRVILQKKAFYFGRKFESMVDWNVISMVEQQARGSVSPYVNHSSFDRVWYNEYDQAIDWSLTGSDQSVQRDWIKSVTRLTLARLSLQSTCAVLRPDTVHVMRKLGDVRVWLLVSASVQCEGDREPIQIQSLVERTVPQTNISRIQTLKSASVQLTQMDVGLHYDVKELMFRHYTGLVHTKSIPSVRHSWNLHNHSLQKADDKLEVDITMAWLDPDKKTRSALAHKLAFTRKWYMAVVEHSLLDIVQTGAIQPGVWQAQLYVHSTPVHSLSFPVFPTNNSDPALMHSLTQQFYSIHDACLVKGTLPGPGQQLTACKQTEWSSFAPDPKSDINLGIFDEKLGTLV